MTGEIRNALKIQDKLRRLTQIGEGNLSTRNFFRTLGGEFKVGETVGIDCGGNHGEVISGEILGISDQLGGSDSVEEALGCGGDLFGDGFR